MNSDEAFTLSWEEIASVYELIENNWAGTEIDIFLFERLQEALQPRDVVEG
jgi:hypothetical protein